MDKRANIVEAIPTLSSRVEIRIGKLLLDEGRISETDVKRVLLEQKNTRRRFGETALRLGVISEQDLLWALSHQFEYPLPMDAQVFSESLVIARQPFSEQAEMLRALRSQLLLRWFTGRRRLLTLAGSRAGDGCSTLTANLGVAFAQLGLRTLLIDTHLRRPRLHEFFGVDNGVGATSVLTGRALLQDSVARIEGLRDLSLLCAGAVPPNPQELLSRPTLLHLLRQAADEYDAIFIDTAPAAVSVDAQIVAAVAGGCLLATRRHHSKMSEVARLKEHLTSVGVAVVGAVINQ